MKKEIAIRLTSRYLIPFTYDNCKIKYDEVEQETGAWKVVEKNLPFQNCVFLNLTV